MTFLRVSASGDSALALQLLAATPGLAVARRGGSGTPDAKAEQAKIIALLTAFTQ
jgi:hypothetical protein